MDSQSGPTKKFNKTEWRKNKYNHKNKVLKFEERRKKSALHKYYKELKKDQLNPLKNDTRNTSPGTSVQTPRNFNPFERAKQELEKRKQEKEEAKKQKQKEKLEREEALQKYKRDKIKKYLKLKQKTRKGQPVMAGRMEILLEKIQKSMS